MCACVCVNVIFTMIAVSTIHINAHRFVNEQLPFLIQTNQINSAVTFFSFHLQPIHWRKFPYPNDINCKFYNWPQYQCCVCVHCVQSFDLSGKNAVFDRFYDTYLKKKKKWLDPLKEKGNVCFVKWSRASKLRLFVPSLLEIFFRQLNSLRRFSVVVVVVIAYIKQSWVSCFWAIEKLSIYR